MWERLACRIFVSGRYDQEAEIKAHKEITGASVKNSYLTINNKFSLMLLGKSKSDLRKKYEKLLLFWLFNREDRIGYQNVSLSTPPQSFKPGFLDRWFNSHEILSSFKMWKDFAGDFFSWIRGQRDEQELWDLGPRANGGYLYYFPLSESWRKPVNRKIDWTMRILVLLNKYS